MSRCPNVYVMRSNIGVKIGITNDPERRRKGIQGASGLAVELVHVKEIGDKAYAVET